MNRNGSSEPRLYSARTMPDLESLRVDGGSEAHGINHRLHSSLAYIPLSAFAATLAGPEGVAQPRPEARPMSHPILTQRLS